MTDGRVCATEATANLGRAWWALARAAACAAIAIPVIREFTNKLQPGVLPFGRFCAFARAVPLLRSHFVFLPSAATAAEQFAAAVCCRMLFATFLIYFLYCFPFQS